MRLLLLIFILISSNLSFASDGKGFHQSYSNSSQSSSGYSYTGSESDRRGWDDTSRAVREYFSSFHSSSSCTNAGISDSYREAARRDLARLSAGASHGPSGSEEFHRPQKQAEQAQKELDNSLWRFGARD